MEKDWRNTGPVPRTLPELNRILLETGQFGDVTFFVGQEREPIKAHTLILSTRSAVFETMFSDVWTNEESRQVDIDDALPESFKAFLIYLYTDSLEVDSVAVPDNVLYLARKYDVPELRRACAAYLTATMNASTVLRVYESSKIVGPRALTTCAWTFILKHASAVTEQPKFLKMKDVTMVEFLSSDALELKEVSVFEALVKWGTARCNKKELEPTRANLRSVLEKYLPLVRFPTMTSKEFGDTVVPSKILNNTEVIQVFLHFSCMGGGGETESTPSPPSTSSSSSSSSLSSSPPSSSSTSSSPPSTSTTTDPSSSSPTPPITEEIVIKFNTMPRSMFIPSSPIREYEETVMPDGNSIVGVYLSSGACSPVAYSYTLLPNAEFVHEESLDFTVDRTVEIIGVGLYGPAQLDMDDERIAEYKVDFQIYSYEHPSITKHGLTWRGLNVSARGDYTCHFLHPVIVQKNTLHHIRIGFKGEETRRGITRLRNVKTVCRGETVTFKFLGPLTLTNRQHEGRIRCLIFNFPSNQPTFH